MDSRIDARLNSMNHVGLGEPILPPQIVNRDNTTGFITNIMHGASEQLSSLIGWISDPIKKYPRVLLITGITLIALKLIYNHISNSRKQIPPPPPPVRRSPPPSRFLSTPNIATPQPVSSDASNPVPLPTQPSKPSQESRLVSDSKISKSKQNKLDRIFTSNNAKVSQSSSGRAVDKPELEARRVLTPGAELIRLRCEHSAYIQSLVAKVVRLKVASLKDFTTIEPDRQTSIFSKFMEHVSLGKDSIYPHCFGIENNNLILFRETLFPNILGSTIVLVLALVEIEKQPLPIGDLYSNAGLKIYNQCIQSICDEIEMLTFDKPLQKIDFAMFLLHHILNSLSGEVKHYQWCKAVDERILFKLD